MDWGRSPSYSPHHGRPQPYQPPPVRRGRGRGRGQGRGQGRYERGAMSMESLNTSSNHRQNGYEGSGGRQPSFVINHGRSDGREWRQNSGGTDGRRDYSNDRNRGNQSDIPHGRGRPSIRHGSRWTQDSADNHGGEGRPSFRGGKQKHRDRPTGNKELERLTSLQPDLIVYELLSEKSGFPLLVEECSFTPHKLDLTVEVLARATITQSNREIMYQLLNKTCTESFVARLMDRTLTLKREQPEKGSVFFTNLHAVMETFASAMITIAIQRLVNLVDSCHSALTTLQAEGYVEDQLLNKYKTLLDFLTEEKKRWVQEEKMDTQAKKKRLMEMDNMEPPDDFRELSVLPTQMDIADTTRPFLRKNVVHGHYANGHHYLDVQFRLLREDFVRPLRIGITQFRSNTKSRIMDVRIYRNVTYAGSKLEHHKIFHRVHLGPRRIKIENSKRLIYGNLVCISNDNFSTMVLGSVTDRNKDELAKGIIGINFEPNIKDFDLSGQFTMIESRAYFVAYKHVLQALKEMPDNIPMEKYVVHVDPQIAPPQYLGQGQAYDLRVMKSNTLMKKTEAILNLFRQRRRQDRDEEGDECVNMPELLQLQRVEVTRALPDWPSEAELGLDSSQRRALRSALTREVAIIQGPPGTGKTFIGLKIVQVLLHNSVVWKTPENPTPILVVCFTNHALDQFLEGMTTYTNSIVRVGSRTQSEKIDRFQINKLLHQVAGLRALPQNIHSTKVEISYELRELEQKIHNSHAVEHECSAPRGIFDLSVFCDVIPDHISSQLRKVSFHDRPLTDWLICNNQVHGTSGNMLGQPSDSEAQQGRPLEKQQQQQQQQQTPQGEKEDSDLDEDAFQDAEEFLETEERDRKLEEDIDEPLVIGEINQVRYEITIEQLIQTLERLEVQSEAGDTEAYLNHLIISGQLEAIRIGLSIDMNSKDMETLEANTHLNIWHLEVRRRWQLYNYWVAKLQKTMRATRNYNSVELERQMKAYEGIRNAEYLHVMRGAAIVGMTTTGAAQHNSILRDLAPAIVVIEEAAEILESHVITSLTAACQHLIMIGDHQQLQPSATVYELATKYGLETSLFERMINNGLAYETLEYQHRMRPEISRLLVPSIYPTLKDHASVQNYPRVLSMTHNVFFLTHQEHERAESDDNNSHENQHEAELLIGLCRHLMLQGYDPKEVTILTTYSGQFFLLRKLQRRHPECNGVRIAVVDNFQGEENNIILLSLVRSNPEGKVGFLRTDNRVCVALSRAKHGLYITGNMDILSESSTLWKKVKEDLSHSGGLGPAFTLRCENHPDQLLTVTSGRDFSTKSPEGGCLQVCEKPLPNCQHTCPKVCHMNDPEHKEFRCRVPCPKILCNLDHKCPKLCYEDCGLCMVILPKLLPCGHTHKIPCHKSPETYHCPTMVEKVIPACQHEVTMPCYHTPSTFPCPRDCDTRVDCGHKCRKKCHRLDDPDHEEYTCYEECTKTNAGCTQQHPCHKKCYQECGACVVMVDKKLPCGHERKEVECSRPAEEIQCKKSCKKTLPCGHKCKQMCYKKCGDCMVLVKKEVQSCGHSIITQCSKPPTTDQCDGQCPKVLPCGHLCKAQCKDPCTSECLELVVSTNKCPKGHLIKLPCHLNTKVVGEAAWGFCDAPCNKRLDCEHPCAGTCGSCLHGRLHSNCSKPCKRPLVCGHICKYPCSTSCPPCLEQCQWKCTHSKCRKKCGIPCEPCKEKCENNCKHKTCKKRCGDVCEFNCRHSSEDDKCEKNCSQKLCQEPCMKKLKCGHECVGFCGDPCPSLCRECNREELTEVILSGNEEEPDARFVLLEDCGHCIEAEGLEMWLRQDNTQVGMKTCPRCSSAIYNNRRYQNIVLQAYQAVLDIKKKYFKSTNNIKKRDIELILQDQEICYNFKNECMKILQKMGGGRGVKKDKFGQLSAGEKTLCHFQAQVLKKATSIFNQQQTTEARPNLPLSLRAKNSTSKHLPVLKPMVEAVVARVMEQIITITPQMEREVSCELQRLSVLPAYWTFQEKSSAYQNSSIMTIRAKLEALMDPTVIYDEELDKKVRTLLKESENYLGGLGISNEEKMQILQAMGLRQGHWYKCPNGHIYCITECGGAMQESRCPDCGCRIGGSSHRLRGDNAVATEMDGARHAAWSEQNNLGNFDLNL